jgi:hypothetical protein
MNNARPRLWQPSTRRPSRAVPRARRAGRRRSERCKRIEKKLTTQPRQREKGTEKEGFSPDGRRDDVRIRETLGYDVSNLDP